MIALPDRDQSLGTGTRWRKRALLVDALRQVDGF
jgi:hypothetical protein